ncbi:hypothetical protein Q8F55_006872 [Vanrija albida]|uniref:N-acetyltransferase domain-containing protein n=1 Tax=Vanrija albida TaxID=181172 RepID=A0ABR3PYB3_9TREE
MAVTIKTVTGATISPAERAAAKRVLVDSFLSNPEHMALWAHSAAANTALNETYIEYALAAGHELALADVDGDVGGVAIWVAPGADFIPAGTRRADVFEAALAALPPSHKDYFIDELWPVSGAMVDAVLPDAERQWWYLPMIGVSPQAQGRGVGRALLGAKVAEVAATTEGEAGRGARAIALYTESPGNIAFYGKLGFGLRAEQVHSLPSGERWHNMFLSYPPDAEVE